MLIFEFVAGFRPGISNAEDCGEKRTNWDHDLAQLGPYQNTWRMIHRGGVAANKGV
jgi:hypothetical protein